MSDDVITKSVPVLRETLGLTESEAKTIVPIFLGGNMTAGGVSLLSGEKLSTVKRTLGRLVKKGLVKEIDGIVPIYKAVSPSLALSGQLTEIIGEVDGLSGASNKLFKSRFKEIDTVVNDIVKSQTEAVVEITKSLSSYEEQILDLVKTQVDQVATASTGAMTSFSEEIEQVMDGIDTTLDDNLGLKMSELQAEIDKAQVALDKDLKKNGFRLNVILL